MNSEELMGDQTVRGGGGVGTTTVDVTMADASSHAVDQDILIGKGTDEQLIDEDSIGAAGNGNVEAVVVSEQQPDVIVEDFQIIAVEDVTAPTSELEDRLWALVRDNAADFSSWTELIQETEKSETLAKIEKVYDAFLGEFPLCYGYWKKYADHEVKMGSASEKIVDVYERAVKAVTYSVDIWMHYSTYAMEKFESPKTTRRVFKRGVSFVGTDYLSHLLWDKYIEFEYSQQEWSRLAHVYTRILQIPLQHLERYHTSFKQIAHSRPLSDLRTPEETAAAAAAAEAPKPAAETEDVPLLDAEPENAAPESGGEKVESGDSKELEEYLAVREGFYKVAKDWDSRIRDFEIAIRRPYFHVKPLDEAQLANWHRYLDFIEKEGVPDKTVKLYERCLIACANYPEYWIRFIQRMCAEGKVELALNGLQRSTGIFVKRRPEIHLFAARFREQQGDAEGARVAFEILRNELVPGLLEVSVKQANFEHRQGNGEAACSVFDAALQSEKLKEDPRALAVLYIQYARFLDQVLKCEDKAREMYMTALDHLPTSKVLWEAAIFFEASHIIRVPEHIQRVDALVEQASTPLRPDGSPGLLVADREEISSIHLEFVDLVGDFEAIKRAETRHKLLFPTRKNFLDSKKRPSMDSTASQDRAKMLKPYVVTTVTPAAAVINNGQVQWTTTATGAAAYVQPQTYVQPASTTVQVQPWTQSYYGGYATYAAAPQAQAAVPQQTVYTGYAQAYAPQEVIQTYTQVQPAAGYVQETVYRAPAPSPTAPQAAGTTIYYGSYY